MISIELFTRDGCSLCEKALSVLHRVKRDVPFDFHEINLVPGSEEEIAFGTTIPVVRIDGKIFSMLRLEETALREYLADLVDGQRAQK